MAGPTMVAACQADELQAAALVKRRGGTRLGIRGDRGWKLKGARRPEQDEYAKEKGRVCSVLQRKRQKEHGAQRLNNNAQRHHGSSVIAISDVTGHQRQAERREKLSQADQAEVERPARQVVDLPANGHRLHLNGQGDTQPGGPIALEAGVGKGRC